MQNLHFRSTSVHHRYPSDPRAVFANVIAMAAPIPRELPVTRATRSFSALMLSATLQRQKTAIAALTRARPPIDRNSGRVTAVSARSRVTATPNSAPMPSAMASLTPNLK